ncbi:cupin-like domain-containing protein, partial [Piptocephalis cylindrospora]
QEFHGEPTALEFLRLVSTNTPAVFRGAGRDWPAIELWKKDAYLVEQLQDKPLSISITPDGYADSIAQDGKYFALPGTRTMPISAFTKALAEQGDRVDGPVLYLQSQNGNMSGEYETLAQDTPREIRFCSEALGVPVDAKNFWMGNHRSVTSLHKDPYENVYGVVCGRKVFTLYPPSDYWCLHQKEYPVAEYKETTGSSLELCPCLDGEGRPVHVPWIPVDPDAPLEAQTAKYPRFRMARPIRVTLDPGDLLYLPSLWFHHVRQVGNRVIAVNWWYDMHY